MALLPFSGPPGKVGSSVTTSVNDTGGQVFSVKAKGAKGDAKFITDGVMDGTTGILTSASNPFSSSDQGKLCVVPGAGAAGVPLATTIASFQSAGQVTLTAVSSTAVTGAIVTWGTDDYAAINSAYNSAVAVGGIVDVPPVPVGYMHSQKFSWPGSVKFQGNVTEVGGSLIGGNNSNNPTVLPTVAPYLTGSVFIPAYLNDDGILLTSQGTTPNFDGIGIRFAGLYNSTGHGVNCVPPADGSNKDLGIWGVDWKDVKVYGHDGNHYGFVHINPFYSKFINLRAYGGGGIKIRADTTRTVYGNSNYDHFYSVTVLNGSAHGVRIESATAGALGQLTLISPQAWIWNPNPAIPNTTPPTSAQICLSSDGNCGDIDIFHPDWESDFSAPIYSGSNGHGGMTTIGGLGGSLNGRRATLGLLSTFTTDNILVISGQSGQSADTIQAWDFIGGSLVFAVKPSSAGNGLYYLMSFVNETFASSYTPNIQNTIGKRMTLTANVTVNNPANPRDGALLRFHWREDSTGGWTVTYGNQFRTTGATAMATTANTYTVDEFEYVSADSAWRLTSRVTGMTA